VILRLYDGRNRERFGRRNIEKQPPINDALDIVSRDAQLTVAENGKRALCRLEKENI
jgi:hypothetical protein